MREIKLRFNKETGECKVEAHGYQGPACADATRFLQEALGECTDFQRTAAWYETNLELTGHIDSNLCG